MEVTDNGCGMTPEQVDRLLSGPASAVHGRGTGIGMRNVNERIRIYFGREYGVEVKSEPDEGTVVRMRMPLVKAEREQGERL